MKCPKCGSEMEVVEAPNDNEFDWWCGNCEYTHRKHEEKVKP